MATLTINFQANTLGDHYIGWRTYNDPDPADPTAFNVITFDVTSIGPQAVPITVDGNLYCANDDITYYGYIIAACQDQTDGNSDGIPDLALTWTITMVEQTDPCQKTSLTCAVPIAKVDVDAGGTGCVPAGATYQLVVVPATQDSEISPASVECTVDAGGAITLITVLVPGLYTAAPTVIFNPLDFDCAPVSPSFIVTMETSPCAAVDVSTYSCAGHGELDTSVPIYDLTMGETVEFCADPTSLAGLPAEMVATDLGNCHCDECKHVTISCPTATTGAGHITYQTCWNPLNNGYTAIYMITRILNWDDTIDLGCILPDTLIIDIGTIDQPATTVEVVCT